LFDLGAVEVGGQMGDQPLGDEKIIAGEQYLGHDIAVVAVVFEGVFGAQVVETVCFWPVVMEGLPGIP